jgi:hypothetical protein
VESSGRLLCKCLFYNNCPRLWILAIEVLSHVAISHHNKKYLLSEQEIQDLLTFCNNIEHGRFWSCEMNTRIFNKY